MNVTVDAKCSGHARCAASGPDFWQLDDLGYNALLDKGETEVPRDMEQQALDGAAACPERAITVS